MTERERYLEDRIKDAKEILSNLRVMYPLDPQFRERRKDYWTSVQVTAEEELYNLRHGDNGKV